MMTCTRRRFFSGRTVALVALAMCLPVHAIWAAGETSAQARGPRFVKHVIDATFPGIGIGAADVDGDGRLDVIAAVGPSGGYSEWSNLVRWYRAPDWQSKAVCTLEHGEEKRDKAIILHLEAVDFSSHGPARAAAERAPEVTVADGGRGNVWWYRYDRAAGAWQGTIIAERVEGVHGTAHGDIDGDGYADLLAPTSRGEPPRAVIWARNPGPGDEQGRPWPRHFVTDSCEIPSSQHYVRLVDVNGDGRLDALHGTNGKDGWFGFWLQGADPRQPWEQHALPGPGRKATNLDAADLDGDGALDPVGAEGHGLGIWWFAAPDYRPARIDETLESPHCLALGDYDGDGRTDVASCGYISRKVAVFFNRGGGTFENVTVDADQCAYDMEAVDLDGDGDLDLLVAGQKSGNVVWYENRGAGEDER